MPILDHLRATGTINQVHPPPPPPQPLYVQVKQRGDVTILFGQMEKRKKKKTKKQTKKRFLLRFRFLETLAMHTFKR